MNPKGNPNIAEYGKKFSSDCQATVEAGSNGGRKRVENERRRKTYREIAMEIGRLPSDELKSMTNDEAVMVALYKKAKSGNVQAIDKLLNLFGEMVFKGEFQLTPMEGMALMREHREKQSNSDVQR